MNKLRKKGFTLIELILVISVGVSMSFMALQSMLREQENKQAIAAGQHIKNIGQAVNNYIVNHFDVLASLSNATGTGNDAGPRTCAASTSSCTITTATLVNEGMLPTGFSGKNVYGSDYTIVIKRAGTAPYYNITGLVTTNTAWITDGNKIRYDLLGRAMQEAGIDSGMSRSSATKIDGYKGSWNTDSATYSNITKQGQLALIAGYGANSFTAFLRRDGVLPMTGDLNMGGKNITNALNITASGTATAGTLKSTGATGVGGALTVAGSSTLTGAVNANNTLTVAGATTLKNSATVGSTLTVGGALNANNNLTVAGLSTLKGTTVLGSTLSVAGSSTLTGAITAKNTITASGNITSSGQVKGATVASTGRMTAGEFLQINKVAVAGTACSPNGLVGRDATGGILSCQSGTWTNSGKMHVQKVDGATTCSNNGIATSICPVGSIVISGSYQLTNWNRGAGHNSPDAMYIDPVNNLFLIKAPNNNSSPVCFHAIANCATFK